jgi:translation initiation factor IF-2
MTSNASNRQAVKTVKIPSSVSVKRFAELLDMPATSVITELMKNKIFATINEDIEFDTASIIAQDLGFETEEDLESGAEGAITLERLIEICHQEKSSGKTLDKRAPIVTVLGHVDHGKTTLLDTIRKANVAGGEAGGITQRISAYQVKKHNKIITFIDTPGHEAFSGMRSRGVSIADIAILVVAADDGVRPQTREVIDYLKQHKIPIIVALNKIDKPEANPVKVKQELGELGIVLEEWGGSVIAVEISAKKNINIDKLLENVLLVADVEDFRADGKRDGLAVILESHLDPQKGPVAVALVKTGTLKVGQDITSGTVYGRIRRLEDFAGRSIVSAAPSVPVIVYGLSAPAHANDIIQVASGKTAARNKSKEALLGKDFGSIKKTSGKNRSDENENIKKFTIVLKADVQGSLEALDNILSSLVHEEVAWQSIAEGVGNITESDIRIAESAGAVVYGFNVDATPVAKRMAEMSKVEIQTYNIIYKLVEDVKNRLSALLPPEIIRTDTGRLNVLAVFKTGKHDMIVGGRVGEGKIAKKNLVEVKRNDETIGSGKITQLQRNKENTDEVGSGNECGITFEGTVKVQEGDIFIAYTEEEKKRTL